MSFSSFSYKIHVFLYIYNFYFHNFFSDTLRYSGNNINRSYVIFFQKIKSAITSNTYTLQNSKIIEASITQHFAYLHGVLQNMEAKLINQLYEQSDHLKNNLEDIEMQLRSQEEKLKLTLQVRFSQK